MGVIYNKSYGNVEVQFIENKSATSVDFAVSGGDHVTIFYTRTSSIDLGIVALAVIGYDYNSMLDDLTPTDANASLLIIPNAQADLSSIFNKYSS